MANMANKEASLAQILEARERRANRQQEWIQELKAPVISFTLNIAGPVKNNALIRRAFAEGIQALRRKLEYASIKLLREESVEAVTGFEAMIAADTGAMELKRLCVELEEETPLGRVYDLDVIDPIQGKLDREQMGLPARGCMICGAPGSACASRRLHSVEELQQKTVFLMTEAFLQKDADFVSSQALRALLYEVCTTPKPGLVDRDNNGSHRDMDIFCFIDSTVVLGSYFRKAFSLGYRLKNEETGVCFSQLQEEGRKAEKMMFSATKGVNTQKGLIFSLGSLCCAMGRLWRPERACWKFEEILDLCAVLVREKVEADFCKARGETAGERFYLAYGYTGVRGELLQGSPHVRELAMPAFRKAREAGASLEESGIAALLALMSELDDTNILSRGGETGLAWTKARARELASSLPNKMLLQSFDTEMTRRNYSPGGSADLLAVSYFLYFCCFDDTISVASRLFI